MRIIKTAISLFIAMILSDYVFKLFLPALDTNSVCVFAMLSVQDSIKGTWKFVFERLLGNILGLAAGFLFLFIFSVTGTTGIDGHIINGNFVFYLFVALGSLVAIYLCKMIHRASASAVTIIVFLGIMFGASDPSPYFKGALIVIQMALGIVVAVSVNMLILPPRAKKTPVPPCGNTCENCGQLTMDKYIKEINNINDLSAGDAQPAVPAAAARIEDGPKEPGSAEKTKDN